MEKVTPFLWYDDQAEEAVNFYTSVFQDVKINSVTRYNDAMPEMAGKVMTVDFELFGQHYTALNGGPQFTFTPAVSFMVHCQSQEEVDRYWDALLEGGRADMCGWLQDRYGVSWQIVPDKLYELLNHPNPETARRVTEAMLQMQKLDLNVLERAAAETV